MKDPNKLIFELTDEEIDRIKSCIIRLMVFVAAIVMIAALIKLL